jgi:prophage antirepressor-like protein
MRSNKPEAEQFQDWVCQEVLPQIRKTGRYEAPQQPLPPTYQEQIGKMQAYVALAESLGMLEDRDRLMVKDMARTLLPLHLGLSPVAAHPKALTEAGGFFLSDRVRALGYCPTRKQEATLMSKGLAREVSKEYRDRHGEKPPQSSRFVDGAVRPVFWYAEGNAGWIDPLIQTWCARVGIES